MNRFDFKALIDRYSPSHYYEIPECLRYQEFYIADTQTGIKRVEKGKGWWYEKTYTDGMSLKDNASVSLRYIWEEFI